MLPAAAVTVAFRVSVSPSPMRGSAPSCVVVGICVTYSVVVAGAGTPNVETATVTEPIVLPAVRFMVT